MGNKYTPIGRKTITAKCIPLLVKGVKYTIKKKLQTQSSVSVTADIWSDQIMWKIGVTAHRLNQTENQLESFLLDCRQFSGRHNGENIGLAFDEMNITQQVKLGTLSLITQPT